MGRAPTWSPKEREAASIAWLRATNNGIEGVEQRGADFREKIHTFLKIYTPRDADSNRYAGRSSKTVYEFLRDNIFPDIGKFNESLRLVESSQPSGVTSDNIVNMAVAFHLKKVDRMCYKWKGFDANNWNNFLAWKILRNCAKFRPPGAAYVNAGAASTPARIASTLQWTLANKQPCVPASNSSVNPSDDQVSLLTQPPFHETPIVETHPVDSIVGGTVAVGAATPEESLLPLSMLDPSRGGRGSAMGRTKAKRAMEKENVKSEKLAEIKKIRVMIEGQDVRQNRTCRLVELNQVYKLLGKDDEDLQKEIKKEMLDLYLEGKKKGQPSNVAAVASSASSMAAATTTTTTAEATTTTTAAAGSASLFASLAL